MHYRVSSSHGKEFETDRFAAPGPAWLAFVAASMGSEAGIDLAE